MAEWSKAVDLSSILRCRRGFEPHSRHFFKTAFQLVGIDSNDYIKQFSILIHVMLYKFTITHLFKME